MQAYLQLASGRVSYSMSALKLIKTYLRTSMQENWFNVLALLCINNVIKLDYIVK